MQINTISKYNNSITCIPERGGLITSIKINNEELLFLNEETLNDLQKNVRGGIPVMFPNAGSLRENDLYKLNQHGFARNKSWQYEQITDTSFKMFLESDNNSKEIFPFDFRIEIIGEILKDYIKIFQKIINTGENDLVSRTGLHPYFFAGNEDKENLKIYLGDEILDNYSFCEGKTVYLDNPGDINVVFPDSKILKLNYDKSYKKLWIRSEIGKDFICIEPVYEDEQALLDKPMLLKSREEKIFEISIEKK